tara:strand:- start:687 stop:1238 length:552 start_codon:yes stop_codon:yes gene_type:complete
MVKKYKWKCRILLVKTPNYKYPEYQKTKRLYQRNIKKFHKRVVKLITKITKKQFSIDLIGFDGNLKTSFKELNTKKLFKIIDKMPMARSKLKLINLSLFSDYNPKTTTHGLGFKDKNKAIYTIKKIKNRSKKYQVNVVATMMGRAKKHPNKTKGMVEAIKVFSLWMRNYKKLKFKQISQDKHL